MTGFSTLKEINVRIVDYDDECYRQPCIYCDSEDQCEHILYEWDFCDSWGSAHSNEKVIKIAELIEKVFSDLYKKKIPVKFRKKEIPEDLRIMWDESDVDLENNISIDYLPLIRFLDFIINEELQSCDIIVFDYCSGGGVGNDDPIQVCYAKNPDDMLQKILDRINYHLIPFKRLLKESL